jgi:hypothetical protein
VIRQQQRPWRVRLVDLSRVLDPDDSFRRIAGFTPQDFDNQRLQRGWTPRANTECPPSPATVECTPRYQPLPETPR